MRDHGHIMALAQHLEQIDTIRLSTTKAAAKAINKSAIRKRSGTSTVLVLA